MSSYLVQREDRFDFRSAEYEDLYRRADATPFQSGVWLSTLYEVLAPRRRAGKVVVTVRDGQGHLILVLPLVSRNRGPVRVIEFADLGVNDYAAPVVDPLASGALLGDEAVAPRIREALGRFDLLRIERVADSPDAFLAMLAGSRARPHAYSTHLIDLPATREAWRKQLDPSFARHLERKYKRLRPKGDRRLRTITDAAEVGQLMESLRGFREARFAQRRGVDLLQDVDCYEFYRAVAEAGVAGGPVHLAVLEVGGEVVAVALDLADATSELFLVVGYDVERLRNYSLGLLIVDELVHAAVDRGLAHFDLTVGDESYKQDFGAMPRPLFEIRVQRTPLGTVGILAHDGYLQARRVAKRMVLAWEARRARTKRDG